MPIQPIRGNPEQKQVYLTLGFQGGMNITYADDLLKPTLMRNLINYDIESVGELASRKGFGKNTALTSLLYAADAYAPGGVNLTTHKEVFFSLLRNDNASWQRLADSASLSAFLTTYGSTNVVRYLRLLVKKSDNTL
jgi:hypothetical protein